MDPQQQPDFNFIMNPQQQQKPGMFAGSGRSKRLLISILFVGGVITIVIIAASVLLSLGKANNQDLVDVKNWQLELTRVIELGEKDVADPTLANRLVTLKAAVTSDQKALDDLLSSRKVKIPKEQLGTKKDGDIDKDLETAKENGGFDEALQAAIENVANDYYASLRSALTDTTSQKEKALLETAKTNLETTVKK